MATTKPTKPSITLPSAFGTSSSNVKTAFTAQELIDGYSASIPQVLDGGNVNWLNDTLFKYLTYTTAFCDWLRGIGSNKVPYINSSNQLDSATPVMAGANNTFTGSNTFSGSVSLGSSATATTKSAGTSDTSLATTEFVQNADSLAVHKSGTETITGYKTFTNNIIRQGTWTAGTPGSSNQKSYINFTDSTGTSYGSIGKFYGAGGTFRTEMTGKKTDGTGEISISIGYDENGNPRALAPTPDSTKQTTSTQIATTGWVNSAGNNVMHLTGDESASGNKTFTGTIISTNSGASVPNNVLAVKTARGSGNFSDLIGLYDTANNCRCATIRAFNTAAEHSLLLGVNNFNDGAPQGINIAYDSSNNLTITGKTPSDAKDSSTKIATTEWVAGHRCTTKATTTSSASVDAPAYVVENYKNGKKWHRVWSDGWIEQGGETTSDGQTYTLSKAFSDTNYSVANAPTATSTDRNPAIQSKTTTNIQFERKCSFYACGY